MGYNFTPVSVQYQFFILRPLLLQLFFSPKVATNTNEKNLLQGWPAGQLKVPLNGCFGSLFSLSHHVKTNYHRVPFFNAAAGGF